METSEKELARYTVITSTDARRGEDGYWTVDQKVVQKRQLIGRELESKELSMSAKDKSLSRANSMVTASILIYLDSVDGDLFNEPDEEGPISASKGDYIQ